MAVRRAALCSSGRTRLVRRDCTARVCQGYVWSSSQGIEAFAAPRDTRTTRLYTYWTQLSFLWVAGSLDVVRWGVCSMALVLPLTVAIDTYYYRRPVLPALNIALYNLGRGPG